VTSGNQHFTLQIFKLAAINILLCKSSKLFTRDPEECLLGADKTCVHVLSDVFLRTPKTSQTFAAE